MDQTAMHVPSIPAVLCAAGMEAATEAAQTPATEAATASRDGTRRRCATLATTLIMDPIVLLAPWTQPVLFVLGMELATVLEARAGTVLALATMALMPRKTVILVTLRTLVQSAVNALSTSKVQFAPGTAIATEPVRWPELARATVTRGLIPKKNAQRATIRIMAQHANRARSIQWAKFVRVMANVTVLEPPVAMGPVLAKQGGMLLKNARRVTKNITVPIVNRARSIQWAKFVRATANATVLEPPLETACANVNEGGRMAFLVLNVRCAHLVTAHQANAPTLSVKMDVFMGIVLHQTPAVAKKVGQEPAAARPLAPTSHPPVFRSAVAMALVLLPMNVLVIMVFKASIAKSGWPNVARR